VARHWFQPQHRRLSGRQPAQLLIPPQITRNFFELLRIDRAPVPLKRVCACSNSDFFGCFHADHYTGFSSSMHAAVYRLREHGIRLPRAKEPVAGELRLHPHQVGTNDPQALLAELMLENGGVALPPLHGAVVRNITKGGMVILGTEILSRGGSKSRVQSYRQTWWCLVLTEQVVQEVFDLTPMARG